MIAAATAVLRAFATSDLPAIGRLCAPDVLVWGTDAGERWHGRDTVLRAFDGVFDLGVAWVGTPAVGAGWVAGDVVFTAAGEPIHARVTMVFSDGLLVHAHYSVAAPPPSATDGGGSA